MMIQRGAAEAAAAEYDHLGMHLISFHSTNVGENPVHLKG